LIGDDLEICLVPFAESHGVSILGHEDADQAVSHDERNDENALRVGEAGERNLRGEIAAAGGCLTSNRAAVPQVALEARQAQQAPLARDRPNQPFPNSRLRTPTAASAPIPLWPYPRLASVTRRRPVSSQLDSTLGPRAV
jgi:hypothetical protein